MSTSRPAASVRAFLHVSLDEKSGAGALAAGGHASTVRDRATDLVGQLLAFVATQAAPRSRRTARRATRRRPRATSATGCSSAGDLQAVSGAADGHGHAIRARRARTRTASCSPVGRQDTGPARPPRVRGNGAGAGAAIPTRTISRPAASSPSAGWRSSDGARSSRRLRARARDYGLLQAGRR